MDAMGFGLYTVSICMIIYNYMSVIGHYKHQQPHQCPVGFSSQDAQRQSDVRPALPRTIPQNMVHGEDLNRKVSTKTSKEMEVPGQLTLFGSQRLPEIFCLNNLFDQMQEYIASWDLLA